MLHTDDIDDAIGALENPEGYLAEMLLSRFFAGDWNHDPHLRATPERFVSMLRELSEGGSFDFTTFDNEENVDEMVVVKDIPFYTLCAHHVVPFFGKAHVAYIPNKRIAGLSKFARAVRMLSKGLNVQEVLTASIADFLEGKLDPIGVGVVMEAEHLCMTMRGAQVPGTTTTTSAMRGALLDPDKQARAEFLSLIKGQ